MVKGCRQPKEGDYSNIFQFFRHDFKEEKVEISQLNISEVILRILPLSLIKLV
jgi:hypothetical protein